MKSSVPFEYRGVTIVFASFRLVFTDLPFAPGKMIKILAYFRSVDFFCLHRQGCQRYRFIGIVLALSVFWVVRNLVGLSYAR